MEHMQDTCFVSFCLCWAFVWVGQVVERHLDEINPVFAIPISGTFKGFLCMDGHGEDTTDYDYET